MPWPDVRNLGDMTDYLSRFLNGVPTVDLVDDLTASSEPVRTCEIQFVDFGGAARFGGPVRTVRCFEDNALVKQTLSTPGGDAVLVIDGGGSLRTALSGDLIAGMAVENGWAGLVINGAVRDRIELAGLPIGIRALGTNPAKSSKTGEGEVDVPVELGGVVFTTRDAVMCDEDGILVVEAGR